MDEKKKRIRKKTCEINSIDQLRNTTTTQPIKSPEPESKEKNELGTYDIIGYDKKWHKSFMPNFKQDRSLNKEELQFWNSIPEWFQTKILERSPTYPNPPKLDHLYYGRAY